jgi:phage terminase small subunit
MAGLTPKQSIFVKEYLIDLNATQAAIRAGYSEKTAYSIGEENLKKPVIAAAIQEAMDKRGTRTEITADRVLEEIAKLAFFDPRKFFNPDGSPIPIQDLDDNTAMALSGIDVLEEYEGSGKDRVFVGYTKKFKLSDKKASLELLGRHLKLFTDKVEHSGIIEVESLTDDDIDRQISDTLAKLGIAAGKATPTQATAGKAKKSKNS